MALTTNLDAYWDFDNHVRSEDIVDRVGGTDLTSSEAANMYPHPVPGIRDYGREFDGADSLYLTHADDPALSISSGDDFTLVFWVMFQDVPASRSSRVNLGHDPIKASVRKGGTSHFANEWSAEIKIWPGNFWDAKFVVNEAASAGSRTAKSNLFMATTRWKMFTACWHMVACRYDQTYRKTNMRIYQGISSVTGKLLRSGRSRWDHPPNFLYKTGHMYLDSTSYHPGINGGDKTREGFTGALDGGYDFRIGAPVFTYATERDKTDFTIDSTGIWSRYLTDQDLETLWNGGYGLDYPFLPPWTEIYAPKPTPTFLPTPHSLYHGHGWNVGTIPENSPAPNGWTHTQPTLPAWRVPPRIAGWSYGNNFPRPAPAPLVSQWWIQASEPVKTDPRIEHLAPGPLEVAPRAGGADPVIPAPPLPPAPPANDSEAIISDEQYRPGRADNDQSRYGKY